MLMLFEHTPLIIHPWHTRVVVGSCPVFSVALLPVNSCGCVFGTQNMAKSKGTSAGKVAANDLVKDKEDDSNIGGTEEDDPPTESAETAVQDMEEAKEEAADDQATQMDTSATAAEEKESTQTVSVTWPTEKNEEEEGGTEDNVPTESVETAIQEMEEAKEEPADEQAPLVDTSATAAEEKESTQTVSETCEMEKNEGEEVNGKRKKKRKRKAEPAESSPPKKAKSFNDGLRLFVGNLNNSKKYDEVKDSLASFFMTQSLLVQDILLDHSRKFAYVDVASEMDVTKALTLTGEMILEKPIKVYMAKVKNQGVKKERKKAPPKTEDKKAKDARCLFVKNLPYTATKEDLLEVFTKAVAVRFPGGTEGPSKGIAFVEFKTQALTEHTLKTRQKIKIQDRVLIVQRVGEKSASDTPVTAEAPPSTCLFVNNLSFMVTEKHIKNVFKTAVSIKIPEKHGKSRGFAFVEFANVNEAKKALESSQNVKIQNRPIKLQFTELRVDVPVEVDSKTLIVLGLSEKTSQETLKSAFEGSASARIYLDKYTGVSKGFGFVYFESDEICKAAMEAMEDCEIDGSRLTVTYAKARGQGGRHRDPEGGFRGQPKGRGRGGCGGGSRRGRGRGSRGGRGPGPNTTSQDGAEGE